MPLATISSLLALLLACAWSPLASAALPPLPCATATKVAGCSECQKTPARCYFCTYQTSPVWNSSSILTKVRTAGSSQYCAAATNQPVAAFADALLCQCPQPHPCSLHICSFPLSARRPALAAPRQVPRTSTAHAATAHCASAASSRTVSPRWARWAGTLSGRQQPPTATSEQTGPPNKSCCNFHSACTAVQQCRPHCDQAGLVCCRSLSLLLCSLANLWEPCSVPAFPPWRRAGPPHSTMPAGLATQVRLRQFSSVQLITPGAPGAPCSAAARCSILCSMILSQHLPGAWPAASPSTQFSRHLDRRPPCRRNLQPLLGCHEGAHPHQCNLPRRWVSRDAMQHPHASQVGCA
jgi:hypothetical protein